MCNRTRSGAVLGTCFLALLLGDEAQGVITDAAIVSAVEQSAGAEFTVVWSDPAYLLEDFSFTPVVEAGLARFQAPAGIDVGAILVLRTEVSAANPSGLYPHDYRVCQSIHAASLASLSRFSSGGGEFLLMEMEQPSIHEFATTLLVREESGSYVVDSQIFSVLYESGLPGKHFTFQIWSKDSATTMALVGRLLTGLANSRPIVLRNTSPRPLPATVVRRVQMAGDRVLLELEAPQTVDDLEVTLVSWEYPDPTPDVTTSTRTVPAGRSILLLPLTAAATDVQVYLDRQGALQDKVLTSFNAWGPMASGWFPFSDQSGSSAEIHRAPLSGLFPRDAEVVMNAGTVRLSGTLVGGGFAGMYVDVLPALQKAGDLRGYDRWIVRAKQTSSVASRPVELKLELDDGTARSTTIAVGPSWGTHEIFVSRFGDWEIIGNHVERAVLAITGSPGAFSLDVDRLSLRKEILPFTVDFESGDLVAWSSASPQ